MSTILLEEAKPLIRHAQLLTIADGAAYGTAKAYDHRIFLCVGGRGEINVANTPYAMQPGRAAFVGAVSALSLCAGRGKPNDPARL